MSGYMSSSTSMDEVWLDQIAVLREVLGQDLSDDTLLHCLKETDGGEWLGEMSPSACP